MAAPPNPVPIAPSCTPTTLYSTSYKPTTTHHITPSSTQTAISTHSTSVSLRTVCANPPGLEMANCLLPFVQTDNVDVFGSLTWVSIDVTRIDTVTETIVQGVKTVPCPRGEESPRPERPVENTGPSMTGVASPVATFTADRVASSAAQAQVPTSSQVVQSMPVEATAVMNSSNPAPSSSQPTADGMRTLASSEGAVAITTGTLTSTRYHSSKPSEPVTPPTQLNAEPEGRTSTGEIVGIVFGVPVGLLVLGVVTAALVHWFKRWKEKKAAEEIDDDEILAWRKVNKEQPDDYNDDGEPMSAKRFSATPSFFSSVSRLAHLARKPYKSPLLKSAPTYGTASSRAALSSRGTLDGRTVRSQRLSQASLGTTVIPHYSQFENVIPLPPLPPKPPAMPFIARPPSTSATISSFGDIEALDEKETNGKRLTPWNPPALMTPPIESPIRGPWSERRRSSRMDDAYGGVGGE